jgi:hypothetical protein
MTEWRLRLTADVAYPTPFTLPPGVYHIGAIADNMSTVVYVVLLRDGRFCVSPLISMAGPHGETIVFQYLPAGQELCGLRLKLCGDPQGIMTHADVTMYINKVCER